MMSLKKKLEMNEEVKNKRHRVSSTRRKKLAAPVARQHDARARQRQTMSEHCSYTTIICDMRIVPHAESVTDEELYNCLFDAA